ncbi:MAG: hypothetical protein VCB42_02410, partial [Myxococcota bacterium]
MHGRLEYLLWAFALIVLVAVAGVVFYRVAFDPTALIVTPDPRAPWISTPQPATAEIHQWRRQSAPVERFFTFFDAPVRAGPVRLRMRALGEATLFLNGQMVYETPSEAAMSRPPDDWKAVREISVGPFLRKGRNSIGVSVRNATGPGLLSLRIDGRGVSLATSTEWLTSVDQQRPKQATLAVDVRPHVTAIAGEKPLASMAAHTGSLLALFALGAFGFWGWTRFATPDSGGRLS